jgi:hypothetical protein
VTAARVERGRFKVDGLAQGAGQVGQGGLRHVACSVGLRSVACLVWPGVVRAPWRSPQCARLCAVGSGVVVAVWPVRCGRRIVAWAVWPCMVCVPRARR